MSGPKSVSSASSPGPRVDACCCIYGLEKKEEDSLSLGPHAGGKGKTGIGGYLAMVFVDTTHTGKHWIAQKHCEYKLVRAAKAGDRRGNGSKAEEEEEEGEVRTRWVILNTELQTILKDSNTWMVKQQIGKATICKVHVGLKSSHRPQCS